MRKATSRRGSALLIVLGMLSFMVVSAIGFAAYMRYSRLPSSYLRRTSASRMLAKAAVAQAIDSVDIAVNNNLHPNIGFKWVSGDRQTNGEDQNRTRNYWFSRVLFGTNDVANLCASDPDSIDSAMPLCLEALAYLPPPLVNDVRYYGKLTPTSQWKPFGFDVGRFSFLAVDVSDYFDINRLSADLPRSSSPASRISLAYLFERGEEHTGPGDGATQWDQFMEQFRTLDQDTLRVDFNGKYPLVSLADFNLALGRRGTVGRFNSPFYDYIKTGGAGAGFYATKDEESEDRIRRMTFVTDGWFPKGRSDWSSSDGGSSAADDEDDLLDLNDGNQPFPMPALATKERGRRPSFDESLMGAQEWREYIACIGCAALFDYLDTDHLPLSLAMPVTERVPMICGISPKFVGSEFGVTKEEQPKGDDVDIVKPGDGKTWRTVKKTVSYKIKGTEFAKGFNGGAIDALVVFPFSHEDETDLKEFTIDGRFSFFFSTEEMSLRTGDNDVLHLKSANMEEREEVIDPDTGVMNVRLAGGEQQLPRFQDITTPESAVQQLRNLLNLRKGTRLAADLGNNELLKVTYQWDQKSNGGGGVDPAYLTWVPEFAEVQENPEKHNAEVTAETTFFKALKADGTKDTDFEDPNKLKDIVTGKKPVVVWLNAAVWLLVKNGDDVVDMVPACLFDDKNLNNVPGANMILQNNKFRQSLGETYPIFRFDTGVKFEFSIKGLNALADESKVVKLTPEAAIVADPRFNYAPESWFSVGGNFEPDLWLKNNQTGKDGRDSDIFMATSDAGYMQSKYELAMLPQFTSLKTYGTTKEVGNLQSMAAYNEKTIPSSFDKAVNHDFMWRTYDPFDIDEDAFDELPWTSEGTGFKVNPYSDNRNVLMAAFANTPMDWKRASTNVVHIPGVEYFSSLSAAKFNEKYAWNAYTKSESSKMSWTVLEKIADNYMAIIKANGQKDQNLGWTDAWQEMDWFGNDSSFCDVPLDEDTDSIWLADRKFFYGYWRDCFAAKQQLYMVFVRAEPMMMGGDSGALAPPQLSARAMALVWRDPCRVRDDKYPHQTRILFYRQFE